jgi:hypothetical protein
MRADLDFFDAENPSPTDNSKTNHHSKVKPCFLDVSRRIKFRKKNRISAENPSSIYNYIFDVPCYDGGIDSVEI